MKSAAPKLSWSITSKLKTLSGSSHGNSNRSSQTGVRHFFFTEPFSLFPSTDICGNGSADAGPLENILRGGDASTSFEGTSTRSALLVDGRQVLGPDDRDSQDVRRPVDLRGAFL